MPLIIHGTQVERMFVKGTEVEEFFLYGTKVFEKWILLSLKNNTTSANIPYSGSFGKNIELSSAASASPNSSIVFKLKFKLIKTSADTAVGLNVAYPITSIKVFKNGTQVSISPRGLNTARASIPFNYANAGDSIVAEFTMPVPSYASGTTAFIFVEKYNNYYGEVEVTNISLEYKNI